MSKSNCFIRQFGNPNGGFGIFLSKIMNISNRKMYKANADKTVDAGTILEIGFGNGRQLKMIADRDAGTELCGVDISEDMLRCAQSSVGDRAHLFIADAAELPFESDFFDAVITTDTCYFWDDPQQVLREIRRVLKVGGVFVNSMNTMYAGSVGKTKGGICITSSEILVSLAKDLGFGVQGYDKLGKTEEQVVMRKL